MIRDNHLDAFITVSGYPNTAIVEMASTQGAELVKVTGQSAMRLYKSSFLLKGSDTRWYL